MRTTLETITPSIAAAWLARNMNNRRPNQRIIDELAAAITDRKSTRLNSSH